MLLFIFRLHLIFVIVILVIVAYCCYTSYRSISFQSFHHVSSRRSIHTRIINVHVIFCFLLRILRQGEGGVRVEKVLNDRHFAPHWDFPSLSSLRSSLSSHPLLTSFLAPSKPVQAPIKMNTTAHLAFLSNSWAFCFWFFFFFLYFLKRGRAAKKVVLKYARRELRNIVRSITFTHFLFKFSCAQRRALPSFLG